MFRLDHVLVTEGLHVLDVRELRGRPSDHRPVVADIAVPSIAVAAWVASAKHR